MVVKYLGMDIKGIYMNHSRNILQPGPAHIKDLVRRTRLEPLGRCMMEYQVTTIVAPAGYGKTVWVLSLLDNPGWPEAVWISLDQQDSEPSILLYHLIRSIKKASPDSDAWRTLMSLENFESEWAIAASAFLDELPRDEQLLLVLDDADFLSNKQVAAAIIEFIINRLPDNIHMVLIARNALPFKLYKQEIRNQLFRIGREELLFLEEEAHALFSNMKLKLSDSDTAALYARSEGWAVGLRLLGIYLQQPGSSLEEALQSLHQENSSFYQYIMNEFLTAMPKDMREFLICASLLPYLEIKLCNAAFALIDSERMLEILQGFGLLCPLEREKGTWRMHHLVENWLQDIAAKKLSPGYVKEIRERTAVFFEESGYIDRAIEQSILSEKWDKAAQLICGHGSEYFNSGFHMDILYNWIEKLPEKLVEEDCWLLYFKGMSIVHVDDYLAFQVLSSAADMADLKCELKCEAGAILAMLLSAISSGDLGKCEAAGRRLLSNPELMTNPESSGEALAAALQYAMARDSLQEGIDLSRQVLHLKLPPEMNMWARYTTSYLYLRQGRLIEARHLIEETLSLPVVKENERRLIVGYEILNDILFIMGDFNTLDEVSRKCMDLGKKYGMLGIIGRVHYLRAHRNFREMSLTAARHDFDLAYEYFNSAGIIHFSNQTAVDILLLRINNGEIAEELLHELLGLKLQFDSIPYGLGIDYIINSLCGIAAMEAGQLELAGQLLKKSVQRWQAIGDKHNLAATNLLLAHLMLLNGEEESCDNLLRKALGAAEVCQWENFWVWHHATIYAMCQRAINKNIHTNWAVHILNRWFPEQSRLELSLLLISPDQELKSLATDYFQQSFKTTGKTVISIFYLGGFRLLINGLEIHELDWKTKKAENLFKFIASNRRLRNKEYLMQQLWPDGEPESNDGRLRMTLSYVRKALGAAGLQPESLIMQRGVISLDSSLELYCDYEYFTEQARIALRYAEANHPFAVPALEKAARIYSGEFLPEDLYEDWTTELRSALHNLYLDVLAQLAQCLLVRGNLPDALQTCYDYLALEPVDETIIRMAMDILWKMNKKHKAMELFRNLEAVLSSEYDTIPEKETAALYRKIQSGTKI